MNPSIKNFPFVLLILDGWGVAPPGRGNAFTGAKIPFYNALLRRYQAWLLAAGGEAVGLPWGEPGNSEVGHLNLGAGKIVYQPVLRINKSIENKTFFQNEVLQGAVKHCREHGSAFHVMGLLSDGGVHSHQDHLFAILELAAKSGIKSVFAHPFLDGRDSGFDSGREYLAGLERVLKRLGVGKIATVSGRFYAMDRDNHWDRIEKTYRAMVRGEGAASFRSAAEAVEKSYQAKVYDEEFVPAVIINEKNEPLARVRPGDSLLFFNYRPDRARQLAKAFILPAFDKFDRGPALSNLCFVSLTEYEPDLPLGVAFPKELVTTPIGRVWSDANLAQLHIAETEKYAHVTYFFNGGQDIVFPNQENIIIPSSGAASYADKPEMSAREITDKVVSSLKSGTHHCLVVNLANADMVGHSGNLRATRESLAVVDDCLKSIAKSVQDKNGTLLITADHGNAEAKVNLENGEIIKEHSGNSVPAVLVNKDFLWREAKGESFTADQLRVSGVLSDVAPTILALMGLPIPGDMTSRSLV